MISFMHYVYAIHDSYNISLYLYLVEIKTIVIIIITIIVFIIIVIIIIIIIILQYCLISFFYAKAFWCIFFFCDLKTNFLTIPRATFSKILNF